MRVLEDFPSRPSFWIKKRGLNVTEKRQYNGLDLVKFGLALLVAARHMIQLFYPIESKWRVVIASWLSNLAVPCFFIMAGFLLFRKIGDGRAKGEGKIISAYCARIFKMALIWSLIYLPIDLYNWWYGRDRVLEWILVYIRYFFLDHPIMHLWFLLALIVACGLVWCMYRAGAKPWLIVAAGGMLFIIGCVGDNWYFNQQLPESIWKIYSMYFKYFVTMRNGVFYGAFFVAVGLWFAKARARIPFPAAAAGFLVSALLMYGEVKRCQNVNMVFTSAPAAFFLIAAALEAPRGQQGGGLLYKRLREMSQWIYLTHVYFLYIFSWTVKWNPLPLTKKGITVSVFAPMLVCCGCLVALSERRAFKWLKNMI